MTFWCCVCVDDQGTVVEKEMRAIAERQRQAHRRAVESVGPAQRKLTQSHEKAARAREKYELR